MRPYSFLRLPHHRHHPLQFPHVVVVAVGIAIAVAVDTDVEEFVYAEMSMLPLEDLPVLDYL